MKNIIDLYNRLINLTNIDYIFKEQFNLEIVLLDNNGNINSDIDINYIQNNIENSEFQLLFNFSNINNITIKKLEKYCLQILKKHKLDIYHDFNSDYNEDNQFMIYINFILSRIKFSLSEINSKKNKKISAAVCVNNILNKIVYDNTMTEEALLHLTNVKDCRKFMRLSYPLLFQVNPNLTFKEQSSFNGKIRYSKRRIQFLNKEYYVTNHIFESNIIKIQSYLEKLQVLN